MNIKELMIGNIVEYEAVSYKVDTIIADGTVLISPINQDWSPEKVDVSELRPIEITKSFLFGNSWNSLKDKYPAEDSYSYKEPGFVLEYNLERNLLYCNCDSVKMPIKFIHQLQNYFNMNDLNSDFIFVPSYFKENEESAD